MAIRADEDVSKAVGRCLNEIVEDIDSGIMGREYAIRIRLMKECKGKISFDDFELPVKPEVVYNSIYDHGIAAAIESFTDILNQKIYGRI